MEAQLAQAPDIPIGRLAGRQHGVVARRQLVDEGITRNEISKRLASGRLHLLHRGVYAVGHTAISREGRWFAAVLAAGDGAALSHHSAAALWAIRPWETARVDVTVPSRNGRRRPGIRIHRCALEGRDVIHHERIPVTSPERTLADLARVLDADELARAVREAQFLRLIRPAAMRDVLVRRPSARLTALISDPVLTHSEAEDLLLTICERHRIPRPSTQARIHGHPVDFHWPAERLVVEIDSWQAHGTRDAFQRDRAHTNRMQLSGYLVLRFTAADLRRRPRRVAAQLRAGLGRV